MTKTHCDACDRTFKNEEALEMHNRAVHSKNAVTPPIKSKGYIKWLIIGAAVVIVGFFIVSAVGGEGEYDEFATCLTDSGAKMWGAYWCPNCLEQKKMFGKSWDKVDYIECSLPNAGGQTEQCQSAGISGYPTWEFSGGERISGSQPLAALSQKTGCALPG
jgi:thiol-disulfide isomerase/thioredoxin